MRQPPYSALTEHQEIPAQARPVAALAEEWLRHRSGELSASTLEVPTWAVRQHLVPGLGARRVRQLRAEDVSVFLQDLALAGYARAKR